MLLAFPLASIARAQVTSATIVGTITDSSGAALPGATVTARNVDTGFNRTVPSNESGAYRLEFLPIGNYTVEVMLSGFKTATRSGVVLNVNDTAKVDASLALGGVAETVNVEADAPAVNTSTSDISKTIDAAAIQTNVLNIVNLGQPGAAVPSGATSTTFGVIRTANAMRRLQLGLRLTF